MAKISTYANDDPVSLNDKVIGTSSSSDPSSATRNYLISDILGLSDASALAYEEGVINNGSGVIKLGASSAGTGDHDFAANRYQYLALYKYIFGGQSADEFMTIDGLNGALGIGIDPDPTSVLRLQRTGDPGKTVDIVSSTTGFTCITLGTTATGEGTASLYDAAGTPQVMFQATGKSYMKDYGSGDHAEDYTYLAAFNSDGDIVEVGGISAAKAITVADLHDYSPNDLLEKAVLEIDFDAAVNFTGIDTTGVSLGTRKTLVNVGDFTGTMLHQNAGSTAGNRFNISNGGTYTLQVDTAVDVILLSTGWQVIGK